jgi:hypothetical protein
VVAPSDLARSQPTTKRDRSSAVEVFMLPAYQAAPAQTSY